MNSFTPDTLLSSHSSRSGAWLPALRPPLTRPSSWRMPSDVFDPLYIAPYAEPDYPHIKFGPTHTPQPAPTHFQLLYAPSESADPCPSPPSSPSTSKSTMPLPEGAGEFASVYSTHVISVLDSPPVMRRVDLASQKPPTPPPTMPHSTLSLPDTDVDMPLDDHEVWDIEEGSETDDPYPSSSSSSHTYKSVSPLPLSLPQPNWDPPSAQALSITSSHDFQESERPNALFSPYHASPPPAQDFSHHTLLSSDKHSSLLEVDVNVNVDAPRPLLAPISIPWTGSPTDLDPEPPSYFTSSSSLTDHDKLLLESPLISRLDLPVLEEDEFLKIVPSSGLADSDIEMDGSTSDSAPLPGQHLVSLPGADTDGDLVPRIPPPPVMPWTPNRPLLFIDDPRDVPLPRSPSPEEFDLCPTDDDKDNPEVIALFDLRKRSVAAERAARRFETLPDDVDLFARAEARKIRKRERERSKEVGALLRLKMGKLSKEQQKSERDEQPQAPHSGVIENISQLVAQMVFRRNETSRPLAKRRMANVARDYVPSTLSVAVTTDT